MRPLRTNNQFNILTEIRAIMSYVSIPKYSEIFKIIGVI